MAKGKGDKMNRFWIKGTDDTRKALAHVAIDLDTTAERLAGYILADVLAKARDNPEALRRLLPREKRE